MHLRSLAFFQTGFRSLLAHKFRSSLSILGIVCGVMAVMSMISTGEGAKREVLDRIEKMGLKNIYIHQLKLTDELQEQARQKRSYGLTLSDIDRFRSVIPFISRIGAARKIELTPVGTPITPVIVRCNMDYATVLGLSLSTGRFIHEQDIDNRSLVCVLGYDLSKQLGSGGRIGNLIRLDNSLYRVVGILEKYDIDTGKSSKVKSENVNTMIFLPLNIQTKSATSQLFDTNENRLDRIVVEVDTRENVGAAGKLIERTLEHSHNGVRDYSVIAPVELLNQSLATQKIFNLVLAVTGGISLLVGGIGIMNIMLASVTERKREIGIRRAVGATQKDIQFQFLAESFLLTLCGGVVGLGTGTICIFAIEAFAGWPIRITFWSMCLPFVLACLTGIFFGLYPAVQAAKMDPIQALRTI